MYIVLSHALLPEGMSLLEKTGAKLFVADSNDPYSYIEEIQKADILVLRFGEFRAPIIKKCSNLKVIGVTGVGYDHVDVKAAARLGIPVVITPGANQHCVAEQVVAFLLMFAKNIVPLDCAIHAGNWAFRDEGKGMEVYGKTMGIIGCGRIGGNVAAICKAMGMHVLGYDILGKEAAERCGCEYCADLETVLMESDFISLHCLLTEETRGMIGKEQLAMMKPTAFLINCARGPIIDEEALAEALNEGRIAGAAVDVYSQEPVPEENPLLRAKNIYCTPHTSGIAKEALARMSVMCAEGCLTIAGGERWEAVVDKSAYEHPRFNAQKC